jgi:hypothetical protein
MVVLVVWKFSSIVGVTDWGTRGKLEVLFTCWEPWASCWRELKVEFCGLNQLESFNVNEAQPASLELRVSGIISFCLNQNVRSNVSSIMSVGSFLLDGKETLWSPGLEFVILKVLALFLGFTLDLTFWLRQKEIMPLTLSSRDAGWASLTLKLSSWLRPQNSTLSSLQQDAHGSQQVKSTSSLPLVPQSVTPTMEENFHTTKTTMLSATALTTLSTKSRSFLLSIILQMERSRM